MQVAARCANSNEPRPQHLLVFVPTRTYMHLESERSKTGAFQGILERQGIGNDQELKSGTREGYCP